MGKKFSEDENAVLDEIICARRSIRSFAEEAPSREAVEQIIRAGLQAPYAALAVAGRDDFRRFFVFRRGTPALVEAGRLIQESSRRRFDEMMSRQRGRAAGPDEKIPPYMERLKDLAQNGHPSIKSAPYFIVVAEYQGIPAAGLQSIAHALENMWLKATALGLAFQLVSVTESMAEEKAFIGLLGLPFGDYVLDGCVIGYPAMEPPPARRLDFAGAVKWM